MTWKHGRSYWAWVRLRDGTRVRRSLNITDKNVAREAERMLEILRGRRDWQLIEAAAFGPSSIGEVFDCWRRGEDGLSELRARLGDVDLAEHVERWTRWAARGASPETVEKYAKQLRALIPEAKPSLRSDFTRRRISEALAALPCSGSTARRYLAAWSSFASYLVEHEIIDSNPVRSVKAPRNNPPRELWLSLQDVKRLVDAQPEPFRALAALREGAGVEISAALGVRRGDVDLASSTVFVRGTKTPGRTRVVAVEQWAMKRLAEYMRRAPATPAALLFEGIRARRALDVQRRELERLELDVRYTLHDARHSYAVRQMKSGVDVQVIAANLGHTDAMMVLKVYGKYRPNAQDRARTQLRAVL
jgi:integrase/recombinase XerC